MAGVQGALFVPGSHKVALPRTSNGIGVFSMGSLIPESEALEFESAAHGESHTWRATREFALLSEILGSFEWGALDLLMFDLPPGAERTVQYADFLGAADVVPARDDPFRGGTGRGRALGGSSVEGTPIAVLGYVENMSGYYCRDCNAVKPLFASAESPSLGIPCLGTVPFDPELARHCDRGSLSRNCPKHPSAGPWTMWRSNFWTASHEISLCPLRQPDEAPDRRPTRARLALGRLLVSGVRLRDGDADQCVRNTGRPVTRRRGSAPGVEAGGGEPRRSFSGGGRQVSVLRDDSRRTAGSSEPPASRSPSGGQPPRKPGSRTFPSSSAPWREPASRDSPGREGPSKWTRRSSTRPATSSACEHFQRGQEIGVVLFQE